MKKFIALLLTVAVFVTISMPAAADFPGPPSTTKGAPITFVPLDPGATTKNYYEEPTTYWMPETITHPTTLPPETTTTTTAPSTTKAPTTTMAPTTRPSTTRPSTTTPPTTRPSTTTPPTTEKPDVEINGKTKVAKISLLTYIHKIHFGHCWIYVENTSDQVLEIGYYQLPPGEGVSIGSFFTTRYDGGGTYYNIESYTVDENDSKGYFSITRDATLNNIKGLSTYLKTVNWWDPVVVNCAGFALGAWMSAGKFIIPIPVPLVVMVQLFVMGVEMNKPMYNPGRDRVYKQKGDKLVIVSDKSADKPLSIENMH